MTALSSYLEDGDRVSGWLVNYSARFIADLSALQSEAGLFGSVGEVGVHMGRLFILLKLLAAPGERTFALDVFDDSLNQDQSGYGNYTDFLANVKQWTGSIENIQVVSKSSLMVEPSEVIVVSGRARLISVDGGHTPECANNESSVKYLEVIERLRRFGLSK